jgi:hypothetical protein
MLWGVKADAGEQHVRQRQAGRDRLGHLTAAMIVAVDEQHAEDFGSAVLDEIAGAHVDRLSAHVARFVRNPLDAAADSRQYRK